MPKRQQWQQVADQTYPLLKKIKQDFIREAKFLSQDHWTLNTLLDYTQLNDEFADYLWLDSDSLDALSIQLMNAEHPQQAPLFAQFRRQVLDIHQDVYAPRPLYWGENRPQALAMTPHIDEDGLRYRCNLAVLERNQSQTRIIGNWVLSFSCEVPVERPAPAFEMTLNSLYLLPEWQGYGVGSVVNRVLSELLCKILAPPLAKALPEALPAPPAMQFDATYTSRNGQRMGRQIARRLAPLARQHGLLYYDSSQFCQQGSTRNMV